MNASYILNFLHISSVVLNDFSCGTNRFEHSIANLLISVNCKTRLENFDDCCRAHDSCYDDQLGKPFCDSTFCSCLTIAANGTDHCANDATAFCTAVRMFGQRAYDNAGKNDTSSFNLF